MAGRRDEILDAFVRSVARRGYERTNFADLASELGMSKGTIVHHFGTKDQLLRELQERYMRQRLEEAKRILAVTQSAADRVAALIYAGVFYQAYHRDEAVAFQREIVHLRDSPALEDARKMRREYSELVTAVVRDGMADGTFRPGDAALMALMFYGSVQWMWTWYEPDGRVAPEALAAQQVDLVMGGLMAGSAAPLDHPRLAKLVHGALGL
ncbi:TetR/AcrR family transcriptional regulator [Catelliglobosispora koreensis]|uniref:TetR/AcrR family transcriptional regulator n=1 Tax=Catelliglobosispora koreensis TaxID=129052 RepID=UPI00037C6BF0|nr:TetR/AcrR family transcriptional regulator [Catelliglobosispora koreensis]